MAGWIPIGESWDSLGNLPDVSWWLSVVEVPYLSIPRHKQEGTPREKMIADAPLRWFCFLLFI